MKRFVSRLARLERLREIERGEARAALAQALAEEQRARTERTVASSRLEEAWSAALEGSAAGDVRTLQALAAWREGLSSELATAHGEVERRAAAAHEALARHAEAARHHRALERLRERRHARWLEEERREEGKFLDEVHQLRVVRERAVTEAPECEG